MITHVAVCLLAHGGKSSISNTFCYEKYSFSVRPIGCTPAFYHNLLWIAKSSFYGIIKMIKFIDLHSMKWQHLINWLYG